MRFCPTSRHRRPRAATIAACAAGLSAVMAAGGASPAQAAFPSCAPAQERQRYVGTINYPIEGAVVDNLGRLYLTDLFNGRVMRMDAPGVQAKTIAVLPGRSGGGALALEPDGTVIVGSGADPRVFLGDILRPGRVSRVNPDTGELTQIARGFSAANGLDVSADGTIYATNDFGSLIGRRLPSGVVQPSWAKFPSANGAVLSSDDRYLYVSRTFVNPGVSRIPIATPNRPESLLTLKGLDVFAAPDGLTLDSQDRPIVPTDVSGEILRIDAPNRACRLASGLANSSVVVYGKGDTGFSAGRLFRAGFDGRVYEIPSAFDAGA